MANKQPQAPLVTSVSTTLKKTIHTTQVVSPEEVREKKKDMLSVIDKSLSIFKKNLEDGKVEMNTSLDLERIVKLTLLLSGEADTVTGKPHNEQEQDVTASTQVIGISMSKVEQILNLDDPEVKAMYEKLFQGYNESNDIEE